MKDKPPVLLLDGVTKTFGSKIAVNELSLSINKGDIFGFLGPNGAGKTTTIRVILDVLRPSRGAIKLFGIDNQRTSETHPKIGYLSGEMAIDGDLTGRQYLIFIDHQFGGGHRDRMKDLAELLKIGLDTKIDSYSRGNRQKIALISALMHQPELLILDEPTSGFDPLVQETFMELIRQYQANGGTVFMSSHILSEVQRLCSRIGFIKDGRLIGVKDIGELRTNSTKTITIKAAAAEIVKIKSSYKRLKSLKLRRSDKTSAVFDYSGEIQALLRFLSAYGLDDVTISEPELEEVFLEYYDQKESL
ncbi:MAG TPA: ABC transporter ATP-binding protein [Candidatus Saccharimonadales bacterium]|nr:ABC transporter ATP-binding protein [Candidatus Saccharimonadales bacterium]